MRPMTPMEFAAAVTAPELTMDQIHAIIRADLDADLAVIQARREAAEGKNVKALPAPGSATPADHEEAA